MIVLFGKGNPTYGRGFSGSLAQKSTGLFKKDATYESNVMPFPTRANGAAPSGPPLYSSSRNFGG